jgi:hypothetical protein
VVSGIKLKRQTERGLFSISIKFLDCPKVNRTAKKKNRGRGPGRVSVGRLIVMRRSTEVRERRNHAVLESLGGVVSTAKCVATLESVVATLAGSP